MNGYILNFIVYTTAMVGIMLIAVAVYKKSCLWGKFGEQKSDMKIEQSLNLSPKKTLYVVNVKNEKFLIASDSDRTSFLAKLEDEQPISAKTRATKETRNTIAKVRQPRSALLAEQNKDKNLQISQLKYSSNIIPQVDIEEIQRAKHFKQRTEDIVSKSFKETLSEQANKKSPVMKNLASQIKLKRG